MNLILNGRWLLAMICLLCAGAGYADNRYIESIASEKSYADTVIALRNAINAGNAKIFQEVDHRNNAVGTDVKLVPSRVFIFGNPKVGARLMECAPLAAVELPLRMLIREDSQTQTRLYWVKASTLLERYEDSPSDECRVLADRIDSHLEDLASTAAKAE
ncbi:DUF302 domain-containing protein [Hydrocarboniclastica marina]|uniref:DUF302 domain-containing protein n=1 Tax=Hydrocarboniclastica marina TaxID=2259620 RepID=A0A4P7XFP6_9ALTE|nr:DUF302 domain-containing protein [Hydrocarboniclastica marina]QCF24557.1 DUF302 domain-containing protein [Hydrocarboniclastica marina]